MRKVRFAICKFCACFPCVVSFYVYVRFDNFTKSEGFEKMSSTVDPAKLKVVELRQELSARGLDTKGNKAVLVKRLKDALEKELEEEIPDTSIADTSTEEFNTSQPETVENVKSPEKEASPKPESPKVKEVEVELEKTETMVDNLELQGDKKDDIPEPSETIVQSEQPNVKEKQDVSEISDTKCEENGEKVEDENQDEPRNKKSRWDASSENADAEDAEIKDDERAEEKIDESLEQKNDESSEKKEETAASESGNEQRTDKRKRGSPSPNRSQRRRSKSPVKEDEPVIDNNKVQLNWYDSDLHLQVDKESFLSARPYHDGAFGYVWAGIRASHGADSGKVCFEVKITEELRWEDNIKQPERGRRDRDRRDSRRDRSDRDKKLELDEKKKDKSCKKSSHDKQLSDNGEKKNDTDNDNKEDAEQTKMELEIKQEDPENKEADPVNKEEDSANKDGSPENKEEDRKNKYENSETVDDKPDCSAEEAAVKVDVNEDLNLDSKKEGEKDEQESAELEEDDTKMESEDAKKEENKEESMEVDDTKPKNEGKEKEEIPPIPTHLIRIGWSVASRNLQLGETKFSYGFESSGKFVTDKKFAEYGKTFTVGDVVGAFLEFEDQSVSLTYTINGEKLSVAISIPRSELPKEFVLFPHILSRNYAFEINLGSQEDPWFANPEELVDFVYVDKVENKIPGPLRPENRSDCEVIMMCGLPASGKTHWVKEYIENSTEKNYTIIGASQLLEKMTVNGNPLKANLKGRWNVLLDRLSKALNKLVEVAALRRRNYIIDQTNIFPSAQRRKMRSFEGFKRRAVIVVCGEEEQAKRRALQEAQDGKDVPDIAVLEMKANMSLPRVGDWIDEVTFIELNEQDAKAMVQKYNNQGKEAGFGPTMQRRDYRDDRFNRWHNNRRNDYRGNYRDRSYNSRYDRGSKYGGGWQNRNMGSWGRNDRRDSHESPGGSRDWRNNNRGGSGPRHQDRGRDRDSSRHGNRDNYNRSRNQGSSRNQGGNWQGGGGGGSWGQSNWSSQGNWQGQGGGGGNWSSQGGWGQVQGQGKWNYNQGYGQQGYGNYPNWSYYGQYQNWNPQGQAQQQLTTGTNSTAASGGNAQAWAQYAQQYAQSNTSGQQAPGQK